MILLAPSILSADFGNLNKDIEMINQSEADWFHVDIMDGVFVPNISFGFPILEALNKKATKFKDVHLMIAHADEYIQTFKKLGADSLTVHYEACLHLNRTIQAIKSEGLKAGVALNPHSNIHLLDDIIEELDLVLIMSVNPGFGGQKFIENTYKKIANTKDLIIQKNSSARIQVDGGVNTNNIKKLADTGADVLVAGSAIFNSENPLETIKSFKSLAV
ncbi:ribulose-phosphate 3-epimerase [Apibacter muscae]|uniref:ribulose-phosphate 3-epimerase n=1 Tax=Apibacter muscae TaxID=2509004 RepID=UPI0011ACED5C|nr:ribulose-phosphate 3-epimerase [Apibacter muscae]TWP22911.1 ribulose-phosphate 3-epimerase [Apibacter muscae]TWP28050.1 ribulose-phosphate 3-epimerase [Apibacter muscae]